MSQLERILTARRLAVAAHENTSYGDFPYEYHLEKCQEVRRRFVTDAMLEWAGMDSEELQIAIWLHDAVEDTPLTISMIEALYGKIISDAIFAVTDAKGQNRKERKWGTPNDPGPMIKLKASNSGLLVKLIDRIANIEASLAREQKTVNPNPGGKSLLSMYRKEQEDFRTLRRESPIGLLWDHVETILSLQ